jgi:hypothetical protein
MENLMKYSISLRFHEVKLPPFDEILVLGKNSPHGKLEIFKSFEHLIPNGFEVVDVEDEKVEAIFVNNRIIAKLPKEKLIKLLRDKVFPYVSQGELLKVDLKITVSYSSTEEEI